MILQMCILPVYTCAGWGCSSVVECLPLMTLAPDSAPSTTHTENSILRLVASLAKRCGSCSNPSTRVAESEDCHLYEASLG